MTPSSKKGVRGYLDPSQASFNDLIGTYRKNARRDGKAFELTPHQFKRLTKLPCHYCGKKADRPYHPKDCRAPYLFNGIDKINPSLGYILSNCVTCCFECNQRKGTSSYDSFMQSVLRIAAHQLTRLKPRLPRSKKQ